MIRLSTRLHPLPLTRCLPKRTYASRGRRPHPGGRLSENAIPLSDALQGARKPEINRSNRTRPSPKKDKIVKRVFAKEPAKERNANPQPKAPRKRKSLDRGTMKQEKKAMIDIYNYAASQGLIPETEMSAVKRGALRSGKFVSTVCIRLKEQGLEATETWGDLIEAEVSASIKVKRQAEEYQLQNAGNISTPPGFELLTTETVHEFFSWLKSHSRSVRYDVLCEELRIAAYQKRRAWITVNGQPVVPENLKVIGATAKEAEKLAWLVAAIHLCREDPKLLPNFKKSLAEGNGHFLPKNAPLDMHVDTDMLWLMREALDRARKVGMPGLEEATEGAGAQQRDHRWERPPLSPNVFERTSKALAAKLDAYSQDPQLQALRAQRQSLPMNQNQEEVLKIINESPFSIVVGATGSGKTTQVPQILLDNAIKSGVGAGCDIICTQPRRIAAISVAQRVAAERNQQIGESIGYHVRFDRKLPVPGGSVNFCTTGILLEQLKRHPDEILNSTSHLLIDEVHERDLNIDFLMIILKKAIKARRAAGKSVPKVVLMSATLDTELFANYFNRSNEPGVIDPCPSISVPGRTFPVKENFLWSILNDLETKYADQARVLLRDRKCQEYLDAEKAIRGAQDDSVDGDESVIDWKRRPVLKTEDADARDEQAEALVPVPLVAATLAHICRTSDEGAILVFLPGLPEILATEELLTRQDIFGVDFRDTSKFKISTLHSSTSKEGQAGVFDPVPHGCRKIILSTNIAETSVTIPDVQYVVDSGKHREKRYDQLRRISKLQCTWISKSNSKQRAGRAGRVQNGNYYALFSRERFESLRAVGLPELLRSDLQETCLVTKLHTGENSSIAEFLKEAIEPPSAKAVEAAVSGLQALEALSKDEELTPLGNLLSKLPIHPTLGKLIVLGVIFRCFDPILILCAAAGERSLLTEPADKRAMARVAHREFRSDQSDQVTILNAFQRVREIQNTRGKQSAWQYAMANFVHLGAFNNVCNTAKQIEEILMGIGLLPPNKSQRSSRFGHPDLNINSNNLELVKALLVAGYHPNLAVKKRGNVLRSASHGTLIMGLNSMNREQDSRDRQRPSRDNKDSFKSDNKIYTFSTLADSNNQLFIRDTTLVTPIMTVMFGGKIEKPGPNRLEMDGWLPFFVMGRDGKNTADTIFDFKRNLDHTMSYAFKSLSTLDRGGSFIHDDFREIFVRSIVDILKLEASTNEFVEGQNHIRSSGHFRLTTPLNQGSRQSDKPQSFRYQGPPSVSLNWGNGQQSDNREPNPNLSNSKRQYQQDEQQSDEQQSDERESSRYRYLTNLKKETQQYEKAYRPREDIAKPKPYNKPIQRYESFGEPSKNTQPTRERARPPTQLFQHKPLQSEFAKRYPHLFA